jgi:hypothetical protein
MKDSEALDSLEKINVKIMAIYEELSFLIDDTPSEIQRIPNKIRQVLLSFLIPNKIRQVLLSFLIPNKIRQVLPSFEQMISDYRDAIIFYNRDDKEKLAKILEKYK